MEDLTYREVLKNLRDYNIITNAEYNFIITVDDTDYDKILQKVLVDFGEDIAVDGYIGMETVNAYLRCDKTKVQIEFYKRANVKNDTTAAEKLYKHLSQWESTKIHFNKTEKGFTTPLGIYSIYHPKAEAVKYTIKLADKYNLNYKRRSDIKRLNLKITKGERRHLINLALDYLVKEFGHKSVKNIMIDKNMKKEYVAYMSISINSNTKMGNKCLQTGLDLKDDGIVGPMTLNTLKQAVESSYMHILSGMVGRIKQFHKHLANSKPAKYGLYLVGWLRRDSSLLK